MSASLRAEMDEALSAVLADMHATAGALLQALADEREALDVADPAALNRAGDGKQAALKRLEELDVERLQLLREISTPRTAEQNAWRTVLRILRECQRGNQRNGIIIGKRLEHVRGALAVLTGNQPDTTLYDPAGLVRHGGRSLPLARA